MGIVLSGGGTTGPVSVLGRVVLLMVLALPPGRADELVLDQRFVPGPGAPVDVVIDNTGTHSQTFTVGVAGTLAEVDLFLTREAADEQDFTVVLQRAAAGAGGAPDDDRELVRFTIPNGVVNPGAPGTGTVTLLLESLGLTVVPGDRFAVGLTRNAPDDAIWRGGSGSPYPGGGAYFRPAGGGWTALGDTDLGFRVRVRTATGGGLDELVLYPTEAGFEVRNLTAGTSEVVAFPGTGPGAPLPRDVDLTLTPDRRQAVFPSADGMIFLDLESMTSRVSAWLGAGAQLPLVGGLDVAVTPDSATAIYATPSGFEIAGVAGSRAITNYAGTAGIVLTPDVDVQVSADGAHAVLPTLAGFQVLDVAGGGSTAVPWGGAGPGFSLPIGVDVVLTPDGRGLYPTAGGWEVLDLTAGTSRNIPWAGRGPLLPLPADVDPVWSGPLQRAAYPSFDGFEILDLASGTALLARWAGTGPPQPLVWSVDPILTPDGARLLYPTVRGIEVLDLATAICTFVPFAGSGVAPHWPHDPLPHGVDIVVLLDGDIALYPTLSGWEVLDMASLSCTHVDWAGPGPAFPFPAGVDVVASSDARHAVFPTSAGWEVLTLPEGAARYVRWSGNGPGESLRPDVDPVFLNDDRTVFLPVPGGFEVLDLSIGATASLLPWSGSTSAALSIGIDPMASPHALGGVSPFSQGFLVDDPGDEDWVRDPEASTDPALPPVWSERVRCFLGENCDWTFPPPLVAELDEVVGTGPIEWVRVPGTAVGPHGHALAESGLELTENGRGLAGRSRQTGVFHDHLVAVDTNRHVRFLLDLEVDSPIIWNEKAEPGPADYPLPGYVYARVFELGPDGEGRLSGDLDGTDFAISADGQALSGALPDGVTETALNLQFVTETTRETTGYIYARVFQDDHAEVATYYHDGPLVPITASDRPDDGFPILVPWGEELQNVATADMEYAVTTDLGGSVSLVGDPTGMWTRGAPLDLSFRFEATGPGPVEGSLTLHYGLVGGPRDQTIELPFLLRSVLPQIEIVPIKGLSPDPEDENAFLLEAVPEGAMGHGSFAVFNVDYDPSIPREQLTLTLDLDPAADGGFVPDTSGIPEVLAPGESFLIPFSVPIGPGEERIGTLVIGDVLGDIPPVELRAGPDLAEPDYFTGDSRIRKTGAAEWTLDFGRVPVGGRAASSFFTQTDPALMSVMEVQGVSGPFGEGFSVPSPAIPDSLVFHPSRPGLYRDQLTYLVHQKFGPDGPTKTIAVKEYVLKLAGLAYTDIVPLSFATPIPGTVGMTFPTVNGYTYVVYDGDSPDAIGRPDAIRRTWRRAFAFTADVTKDHFRLTLSGYDDIDSRYFTVFCYPGPEPLDVLEVEVNDGESQRRTLKSAMIRFNRPPNVPDLITSGAITGAVRVVNFDAGAAPTLEPGDFTWDAATNSLRIDLSSLPRDLDADLELQLDTSQLHAANDPAVPLTDLDGVSDGIHRFGRGLHQRIGDLDGDGQVGFWDRQLMDELYPGWNERVPAPGGSEEAAGDLNDDGFIDPEDFFQHWRRSRRPGF